MTGTVTDVDARVRTGGVDGRTRRAQRTREAVVDAMLALLGDGDLRPTAERIAERAGVSLRALWTNFGDMEGLLAVVGDRLLREHRESYRRVPARLPLRERVSTFCAQRAELLERLAPASRAARLREPFSPQLRRNRAAFTALLEEEIDDLFGAELAGTGGVPVRHALLAAASWPTWLTLRDDLGLSTEDATAALSRTVAALLAAALTGTG